MKLIVDANVLVARDAAAGLRLQVGIQHHWYLAYV
jgi:hypothetical protein